MEHREESESSAGNTPSASHTQTHDSEANVIDAHIVEPNTNEAPIAPLPASIEPYNAPSSHEGSWYARNKSVVVALCIAILIFAGAGGYYWYENMHKAQGPVIAVVNGEKIYASEKARRVAFLEQSATSQGQDVSAPEIRAIIENQAMDMLVNDALLLTASRKAGYTATPEAIQKEVDTLIAGAGSVEAFQTQLVSFGLTEEELRENIAKRIMTESYLNDKTGYDEVTVSKEEIAAFYKSISEGNKDVPKLADISPQIEAQLGQQKQQQIIVDHLITLKDSATIEIKE